ncbi:hypothetical protein DEO72_LG5g1022 [Vigna unguiculata]|uniref:TF-B3 domain-containing protein n=1 Tax=Vigna unguiculata TaxID=3917 RepID=A0A4D6LWU5_VIGUN|nr:hypothetical protein DEO72_LG5g1022 [Vigna unguiculata]
MESTGSCSIGDITVRESSPTATKVLWTFTKINIHDQDLNVDFAEVIKSLDMDVIYLVGRRRGVECKLLVSQKDETTKLGQGWRKFCSQNRLKEGDRLVFEVDHVQKQPVVEVYINGCYCDVAKSIDLV